MTAVLFDRAAACVDTGDLDDHDLVSALCGELSYLCSRFTAYSVYEQWRARVAAGRTISTVMAKSSHILRKKYSKEDGVLVTVVTPRDRTPLERRPADTFREYWVQGYVKENFGRLGFDECQGPFEAGPDFKLRRNGSWHMVEVETVASTYFRHGHHQDSRWSKVRYLIALEDDLSPSKASAAPERILIDRDHFDAWCRSAMKAYAQMKAPDRQAIVVEQQLLELAEVFRAIVLETCPSKERDMAMCPNCSSCPYFGEGEMDGSSADLFFLTMAATYLECSRGRVSYASMFGFFDECEGWQMTGLVI